MNVEHANYPLLSMHTVACSYCIDVISLVMCLIVLFCVTISGKLKTEEQVILSWMTDGKLGKYLAHPSLVHIGERSSLLLYCSPAFLQFGSFTP